MSDQCKHCTVRGDIEKCKATECFLHESWFAQQLLAALAPGQGQMPLHLKDVSECRNVASKDYYECYNNGATKQRDADWQWHLSHCHACREQMVAGLPKVDDILTDEIISKCLNGTLFIVDVFREACAKHVREG